MTQILRTSFICMVLLHVSNFIYAQSPRTYTSLDYNLGLAATDTLFRSTLSLLEREASSSYYYESEEEVTIPIVFHILHTSLFNRVDAEQIAHQIDVLNQDFGSLNFPDEDERDFQGTFRDLAAAPHIKFCTPSIDPNGLATTGINFRNIPLPLIDNLLAIKESLLGIAPWNAQQYLNVWVTDLPEGVGGFAQMPGGNPLTDGIVIDPQYFGIGGTAEPPYDKGRTLTHLIGNYLGLKDIWGQGECSDDGVKDTPVHNAPNIGIRGAGHTSTCDGYPAEMSMNFMDNTDDDGVYMFTKGQVKRMRWVLSAEGLRPQLHLTQTDCNNSLQDAALLNPPKALNLQKPIDFHFEVWPNPSQERFTIRISNSDIPKNKEQILQIFSLSGKIVHQETLADASFKTAKSINASTWVPGIYLVKITAGGQSKTKKIVLQ